MGDIKKLYNYLQSKKVQGLGSEDEFKDGFLNDSAFSQRVYDYVKPLFSDIEETRKAFVDGFREPKNNTAYATPVPYEKKKYYDPREDYSDWVDKQKQSFGNPPKDIDEAAVGIKKANNMELTPQEKSRERRAKVTEHVNANIGVERYNAYKEAEAQYRAAITSRLDTDIERAKEAKRAKEEEMRNSIPKASRAMSIIPQEKMMVQWTVPAYTLDILEDTKELLEAPTKGSNWAGSIWAGFRDNADMKSFLSFGMSTFAKTGKVYDICKRYTNGEALTDEETNLLEALAMNTAVAGLRAGDVSGWYRSGEITGDMVEIMGQFLLTGGIGTGATNVVSKAIGSTMKKILPKVVSKMGAKGAVGTVLRGAKFAGKGAVDVVAGGAAQSIYMPSTYSGYWEKKSGTVTHGDKDGEYNIEPSKINDLQAMLSSMAETGTERLGGAFVGAGSKILNNIVPKSWAKLSTKGVIGALIKAGGTANKYMAKAGVNSTMGELSEEFAGAAFDKAIGASSDEEWKAFWSKDNMLQMIGGFAPMSMFGLGMNGATIANKRLSALRSKRKFVAFTREAGSKEGVKMAEDILNTPIEDLGKKMHKYTQEIGGYTNGELNDNGIEFNRLAAEVLRSSTERDIANEWDSYIQEQEAEDNVNTVSKRTIDDTVDDRVDDTEQTIPQVQQGDEVEYDNARWIVGDVAEEDGEYTFGDESIPLKKGNVLMFEADGNGIRILESTADLYAEDKDNGIESRRQEIYEKYRPVMNVDTGNIIQLSSTADNDNIAYVVKGRVVYDEEGNIDYDKSDDTIYYKVYDKEGNEVDGGTPRPLHLKTHRTEFGKVLSDTPIEEYVDNELYPQKQNNIQQAINNGQTNVEQSTPEESVSTDERQGVTHLQNTVLDSEEADILMSAMEDNAEDMPVIELTPDNWVAEFGQNGTVSTPIGDVKMGDNQLAKLFLKKRTREFGMIKPTLVNPDVIIEKTAVADNAERNTKLLFVKTFKDENGQKHVHFENVTVQKGGLEVSISSHIVDKSAIRKELANGIVIYNKPELTSIGSDVYLTETHEGQSDLVPTQKANSDLQYKGTTNKLDIQEEFYNSLPKNKKGEIDENRMSAEQKIRYAQIEFGEDLDLVKDYITEQSKALSEKIAKLTNKTGKSVAEYKELAALKADKNVFVDYLHSLRDMQEDSMPRQTVEEAAAKREESRREEQAQREQMVREKEEREGVPDFLQDTPEDARLRGFRLRTGERIDRQEPIEVSKYNTARRKFTNDTGAVEEGRPMVKRTIIDNAQTRLQPSHRGGRANIYHFITEAQPKERTDKASRVSAAQIAANINPEEITGGITAYNGSPIANNRLEVIQGNNRAEALRLMYEEYPQSAETYKQYLIDNAENYGMSADEVRTMKEPIAVDIYEGTDGNAILLGQYTQQDVESGGVHRINPSGVVKHLKSHNMLDRFITTLLNGVDEENSVSDVISSNLRGVLPILDKTGAISMTQRQGFFDERGDVTSGAIDDFKGILTSLITEGGYANINSDFLNLPDSAKTALYLQTYRAVLNKQYGPTILNDIQNSILLYTLVFGNNNKGKIGIDESRREVMSWLMTAQPDFNTLNEDGTYPLVDMRKKFSNFAAELAILYKSTNLRSSKDKGRGLYNIWDDFYNLLEGKGDLFTAGEKKSLQESINENFNIDYVPIRQNERNTLGSRGEASRAGRRGSESELSIGEQSEAGTAAADDRGRTEADIAEAVKDIDVEPTEAQKKAGNYKKGHVKIQGFDITIENPKGAIRKGVDDNGKAWSTEMKNHYGYFKNTEGKDGDHIDVFIGDNPNSKRIFVVDQINPKTKEFDESKVMLGFDTEDEAKKAYLSNYSKDWKGFKDITYVDIDTFRDWLYDGAKQRKPFGEYSNIRFRSIKDINDRFNEELQQQIDGTLPKGHVYSLGMPNDILRSAGLPNLPIEMSAERLAGKSQQANHPFELSETEGLPAAIQHPIAIFDSTKKDGSSVILTELKHGDSNFVAVLGVRQSDKQRKIDVEVNSIRSLYPKTHIRGIIDWFNSKDNLLRWVDKEKALNFISTQEPNYLAGGDNAQSTSSESYLNSSKPAEVRNIFKRIAKVIKDFDNPTLSGEKNERARLKASKRKARGATTEKFEELVTLLKKTGFADVKTGEDFYNALAEIEDKEGSRFMIGKQDTEAYKRAIAEETADIKAKAISDGTFMKAPNGKDTNLTERQWLQVRTKAFKKWFGDWEKAYKLELIENLQPIEVDNIGLSRERAEEEYKKIGTSKTNRYDNRRIEFVNNAFGKIARHKNSALILDIIPQLNDLFESAIPIYFEEEREPLKSTNIVGSHNYLGKVRVNDEDYYVRITAQELTPSWKQNEKQGKSNFHNMAVSDIAIYDESGSSVTAKDYSIDNDNRNRFVDAKLQHFFETAREARKNSSKVVDGNGEPLVVYHGTDNAGFTEFEEQGEGLYFSNIDRASWYVKSEDRPTLARNFGEGIDYYGGIYACFLNIRKPKRKNARGKYAVNFDQLSRGKNNDGVIVENIKDPTYDSGSDFESTNYIVFNPTQIKSATDNIGTFDGEDGDIRYRRPNGTVLGFVKGNTIYLNPDEVSLNTPIHEFGHLWVSQVKEHFPDLWAKGKELFLESDYLRKVQADPNYRHLDLDGQIDEAMARAIGDRGEQELDKTLLEKILDWIAEVWEKIGGVFGIDNLTSEQISNLTLQDFTDMATSELLSGQNLTERVNGNSGGATRYNTADETADIKAKAILDGTFMKAPNGKDTNLTERQWLQVRTKAFKKWFGDWEKTARIEKLKKTKPIEITGEEYKGKYELNRDSAKSYIKDSLRGEYTNKDTGDTILLAKDGAQKVTSHSMGNEAHLKSIAVIPELIEKSIFIDELPNEKNNGKYDSYRYYVSGLKIGDVDYTVKLAIGIDEYGNKYYDHSLTEIEKGKLIDEVGALSTTLPSDNQSAHSEYKDSKLISLLQTNSSKVVDENGEPLVVYHGTNKFGFTVFDKEFSDDKTSVFFTDRVDIAKGYAGVNADVRSLYDDDTTGGYSKDEILSMLFADVDISSHTNGWDVANAILPYLTEDIGITAEYDDEDGVLTLSSDYTGDTYRLTDEEFSWEKVENWLRDNADLENVIDKDAGIYGVFVNARNVLDIDAGGSMWSSIPKKKVKGAEDVGNMDTRDIVEHAKKLNYDGVYIKDLLDTGGRGYGLVGDIEGDIFISLVDKNQIKSATDNIGTFDVEDEDIRYSVEGTDYFVNERFNEQLEKLTEENADSTIFYLGEPSAEMLAVGIKDSPLKLYGNKLQSKAKKHGFDVKDIKDLPEAIHDPIAIFEGAEDGSFAILTELSVGDNNVLATLSVGKGNDVDFNIVSSVYGKYNKNVVGWINKGKTLYVNKEKALDYLRISAPIAEAQDKGELNPSVSTEKALAWQAALAPIASATLKQELITATKIIENFENPPINEKKVIDGTTNDMARYSIQANDQLDREDEIMGKKAAEIYEARVKMGKQMNQSDPKKMPNKKIFDEINRKTENIRAKTAEHAADCYLPIKHFIETLNKHGYNIADYNNWYMNVFSLASKNEAEFEKYQAERSKPLQRAAKAAMDSGNISYRELENYLILKHGQERNKYYKERDEKLGVKPMKDYSGTEAVMFEEFCKRTGIKVKTIEEDIPTLVDGDPNMIRYDNGKSEFSKDGKKIPDFEVNKRFELWRKQHTPEEIIEDYEEKIGKEKVEDLWGKIRKATQFTLDCQKEGGLTSEDMYKKASGMWEYFVPLRGFDMGTAQDEYDYDLNGITLFTDFRVEQTLGRTRRSVSPLAWTEQMAHITIQQKNKNLLNQSLRRLASVSTARKDNIMFLSKQYKAPDVIENGKVVREGSLINPPAHTGNPTEDRAAFERWEASMKEGVKNGTVEVVEHSNVNFGMIVSADKVKQHVVRVYEGGRPVDIIFNTSPSVPRAINGLNHKAAISNHWIYKNLQAGTRLMAQTMTTLNPAFVGKNFTRDYLFANTMLLGREDMSYATNFNKNIVKAGSVMFDYVRGKSLLGWAAGDKGSVRDNEYGRLLTEFVMNGGKTGFSQMLKFEKMSSDFKKQTEKGDKKVHYGVNDYIHFIEAANDYAENITRFAAYCTSRQAGRSIERSISDAKELTINFNRKGTDGGIWGTVRSLCAFSNASIQALVVFSRGVKANPKRMSAFISGYTAMAITMAVIARLIGGDDDDYFKLSKYDRQNNLCLPMFGGGFLKIPLPQEMRVFYKLGDEIALCVWNNEPPEVAAQEVFMGALDLLPSFAAGATSISDVLDEKIGAGDLLLAHQPITAIQPITQLAANRNFLNYRIYDDNKWGGRRKELPEYRKALRNKGGETYSPNFVVKLSEGISRLTGGSDLKRGVVEVNPDVINHLMRGYFGGLYSSAVAAINMGDKGAQSIAAGEIKMKTTDSPTMKAFYVSPSNLRYTDDILNARYMDVLKEAKKHANVYANYLKEGEVDRFEKETKMTEDEALDWRYLVKTIDKEVQELRNEIATAETTKERDEALRQLEALQREAIDMAVKLKK
jgi:hypothetical protein